MEKYEECKEKTIYCLVESLSSRNVKSAYELIKHYCEKNNHFLVLLYYEATKDFFEESPWYAFYIPYYVIISSYYLKRPDIAIQMYERIVKYQYHGPSFFMKHLSSNAQFYDLSAELLTSFQEYIHKKSIFFYVGPSFFPWNDTYGKTHALGGSEQAVRYLSKQFPEYVVYVCGDVIEETIENVHYVKEMPTIHFEAIIVSRNLSIFEKCPTLDTSRILLMAHDMSFYGVSDVHGVLKKWLPFIKACVCLTPYHEELFSKEYPYLPLTTINNGIEPSLFSEKTKHPNRFIFTSRSERGLATLLCLWPSILEKRADATLVISSYEPFPKEQDEHLLPLHSSIQHVGKLSPTELYEEMAVAEYWLFPSDFLETSCITALEMMASKVKCLYYPIGGLVDTMGGYGIKMTRGKELDALDEAYDLDEAKEYAMSCSWENRAIEWKKIIEPTILNLIIYNPSVPYEVEMKKIQDTYIHSYSFVKSFYISFRNQPDTITIENNIIYVKGEEDLFHIIQKTIASLRLPFIYDYAYRTNISTITNFDKLLPQLCVYGGDKNHIYNLAWKHGKDEKGNLFGLTFVQGTSIVLDKKAVHCLLNESIKELEIYEDDLIIAKVLDKYKIYPTPLNSFIYRNKSLDRMQDVNNMKMIVSQLNGSCCK